MTLKVRSSAERKSFLRLCLLASLVGIGSGFIALGFRYLILGLGELFSHAGLGLREFLIISPALGALVVGWLVSNYAKEAKGHGVPEIMEAVELNEGVIRTRVVLVKALASALTIGSGGSAGREGPIAQIGAAIGSTMAQKLDLSLYETKVLVACGVGSGIAATFNTPLGGALFAFELILREFKTRSFIPLVIATVFGTLVSRNLLELIGEPILLFELPAYHLKTPWELGFYFLLGLLAGGVAYLFIRTLYGMEDLFDKLPLSEHLKAALGGLSVGLLGYMLLVTQGHSYVNGVGYDMMELIFANQLSFGLMLALVLLKLLATSLSIGSGGSGGIFSPSLYIGAMLGGAYGWAAHEIFPDLTAGYEAYAIVGMAAVFASASRATLTSIIMIFEMTGEYSIILPLMFACVTADAMGYFIQKETIYTMKLARRGIVLEHDMEINLLCAIRVEDIMQSQVESVTPDTTLEQVMELIVASGHMGYPVLDHQGRLTGIITRSDVKRGLESGLKEAAVEQMMTRELMTVNPGDDLDTVVAKVGRRNLSHFPVVDNREPDRLVGFFTDGDVVQAYAEKRREMRG